MTEKLMTIEQQEKVIELLNSNGYDARESKWDDDITIAKRPSSRYATLCVDGSNGFYISTTGTWLMENDSAELYLKELTDTTAVLVAINKILEG